mmetsp:Transcript_29583/g.54170  ORF Transcript_29583/g.54170 Transcript_29583/m.54170 type:complete len:1093 (-) Transcript_29583:158-3436(-)
MDESKLADDMEVDDYDDDAELSESLPLRLRSAVGYVDETDLRTALENSPHINAAPPRLASKEDIQMGLSTFTDLDSLAPTHCCDWQTPKLDLATSHPHTMEDEVKRLMELKEYAMLDTEHDEKFERITALASRIFEAPICLVSLVDIGRQWFKSNRGLGEVRETTREYSFCAHAILSKQDVFIVPDTFQDPRFITNGLVTGPPYIRFYAGAPVITPGGYKLGTFCIIDSAPRPNGLTLSEKQNLRELTEMVVDTMVHRKKEMEHLMDEKTRLIACAAHDLLSPLSGIRLNLGLLMEDESLGEKMDENQRELMESSLECSDVIERICVRAIESFRGDMTKVADSGCNGGDAGGSGSNGGTVVNPKDGVVDVDRLISGVERVIGTYPKRVPLFVEKADNVPRTIVADDLKLFRSTLNYLTNACKHTSEGSIKLRIYIKRAAKQGNGAAMAEEGLDHYDGDFATDMELDLLPGALVAPSKDVFVVEVHDTGPGIDLEKYPALFTPLGTTNPTTSDSSRSSTDQDDNESHNLTQDEQISRMTNSGLGLYSVATEITSLGGEYGVFPRQDLVASHPDNDHHPDDDVGCMESSNDGNENSDHFQPLSVTGCVFWFSVPLVLPPGEVEQEPSPTKANKTATRTMQSPPSTSSQLKDIMENLEMNRKMKSEDDQCVTATTSSSVMDSIDRRLMPSPAPIQAMKRSFNTVSKSATDISSLVVTSLVGGSPATSVSGESRGDTRETNGGAPTHPPASKLPQHNPVAKRHKRMKRALIIDDSLTIRKGLVRGFTRLGFEVDEAENGLQGFKKLKAECYELVMLDFLMPVMDGPDVARKFREWEEEYRPDFHQYIIGISAHANGKDAEQGLKAGMDRFMGKPVPLKSLKDVAQCRPVLEASAFLDTRFKRSCDALEAAYAGRKMAQQQQHDREDCGVSKSSSRSNSSISSTASSFAKYSCLIITNDETGNSSTSSPLSPSQQQRVGHSIQRIVEKNGWRAVAKHGSGEDALRLLKLRNWDVAFIDDDLPVMSGTNCLVRFRDWERRTRVGRGRQMNIFVISDSVHSVSDGFDGVLAKPVDPIRVFQILEDASGKSKPNYEILLR